MSATNLKPHINLYFNPDNRLVSTSGNLPQHLPPLLPFSSLSAPGNTLVNILLQLMKVIVLAESSILQFISSLGSLHYGNVYRCESGRCRTLSLFLRFFYCFTFPGFSFVLIFVDVSHLHSCELPYTFIRSLPSPLPHQQTKNLFSPIND